MLKMVSVTQTTEWLGQHQIYVVNIIATVAIVVGAAIVILVLTRLLQRWLTYVQGHLHLTRDTNVIIGRAVAAVLWFVAFMVILDVWGVGLGGVWAVLISAITVIGVGFLATWAMISNFTASFLLILWRPFHLGDTVEIVPESLKGKVTDRNLMFTTLREESGAVLQIPNNFFFQKMFRVSGHAMAATEGLGKHRDVAPLDPEMAISAPSQSKA